MIEVHDETPEIEPDVGAEDFEIPDARDISVADAVRLWDKMDREGLQANKRAERIKKRKATMKSVVLEAVEHRRQQTGESGARVEVEDGREIQVTPYDWEIFSIKDPEAFKAWAANERENFYDSTPRLREDVFRDRMRQLSQDKQPLPPGVVRWNDVRLSKTASPRRRKA